MNKQILRLAGPNIISNITVPLLGMIDLAIVGHLSNVEYINAIAVGTMIFNFLYWNFGFLRMGTSGFTAQAYGAKKFSEIQSTLVRSFGVALCIAVLILILQKAIVQIGLHFVDGNVEMKNFVREYFYIRVWAAPATLGLYVFNGWFLGMQNARIPMFIAIIQNILNIAFSYIFAIKFDMQIAGVALGTVIAQYGGLLLAFIFYCARYKKFLTYTFTKQTFERRAILRFFKVNKDIFLRTVCLVLVFSFFTIASSKTGENNLAVNTLLLQFFTLFSYIMDGFAYAGESIVGKYVGAKNGKQISLAIRQLFKWGFILSCLFMVIYAFFGKNLLHLFTDKIQIIDAAGNYFIWILIIPLASFAAFLWDGILIGATESRIMRNSMFVATTIFFTIYYLLKPNMQNNALWLAFVLYLFMRGIVQWLLWRKVKRLYTKTKSQS